jgi:hypothetical protein
MPVVPLTRALYYPWIDIKDAAWLKSAFLYWDKVLTIVPASEPQPYKSVVARKFQEAGLLEPYRVTPDTEAVHRVAGQAITYLRTPEGIAALTWDGQRQATSTDARRMTPKVRLFARLGNEKLAHELRRELIGRNRFRPEGDYIPVDARFANYYMTLLAQEIAGDARAGLLTDMPRADQLVVSARSGVLSGLPRQQRLELWGPGRGMLGQVPAELAQGILAQMSLRFVRVAPDTPVERILRFREKHSVELARFRTRLAEVASGVQGAKSWNAILQWGQDAANGIVKPELADLRENLRGSGIKHTMGMLLKVASVNVGTGTLAVVAGLSVPLAVAASAGLSLAVGGYTYARARSKILRDSPCTFLLKVEKWIG